LRSFVETGSFLAPKYTPRRAMRHAYKYSGAFETNYPELAPGSTTYKTTEGKEMPLA
jgi:hypothetical protein